MGDRPWRAPPLVGTGKLVAKRGAAKEGGAADGDVAQGCGGGRDGAAAVGIRGWGTVAQTRHCLGEYLFYI